jgi:hypothetical protein
MKKIVTLITALSFCFITTLSFAQIKVKAPLKAPLEKGEADLSTNMNKQDIINGIKKLTPVLKPFRKAFIKQVEDNMEFDKMYIERKNNNAKMLIIPMKKVYFSQHIDTTKPLPLQYIVITEYDKKEGKIMGAELVLIYPEDKKIICLPKKAFEDFAYENNTQINAVLVYINFGDVKQYEITTKNGKITKHILWESEDKVNNNGIINCIDWTEVITTFDHDYKNAIDKVKKLGTTCTECPPGFKCDPIK